MAFHLFIPTITALVSIHSEPATLKHKALLKLQNSGKQSYQLV
jgi:hypothetical protein